MDIYIVRQPILDSEEKLEAYEVIYQQDSSCLYNQRDSRVANAIIAFFSQLDDTNFLGGKGAFLTFTPNLLMQYVPHLFDPEKLTIQIEDSVLIHPAAKAMLQRYKDQGFKIALLTFNFNKRYLDALPMIDIMKINFENNNPLSIEKKLSLARQYKMKTIAYNVNTVQDRNLALALKFDAFQGKSISDMVRTKVHKAEHLQSNFFRLMAAISRKEPDFDEIAQIIHFDVVLTFSLIRIVNSAYFALANRVKDIKQALTILGIEQLKNWIYLLSFSSDGGISGELIKISFLRGKFCEELAKLAPSFPIEASEAYLLGMFSTLDVLLEVEMAEAIKELPIDDEIKKGLVREPSKCTDLLELCIAYEHGDWSNTRKFAIDLGISERILADKYLDVVEHVNEIWNELTQPFSE